MLHLSATTALNQFRDENVKQITNANYQLSFLQPNSLLMEQVMTTALFFDGYGARPASVRVLLSNGRAYLHDPFDNRYITSYPLKGASYNHINQKHYLYFSAHGAEYLELEDDHPIAPLLEQELSAANPGWAQKLMQQKLVMLIPLMLVLMAGLYFLLLTLIPFIGLRMINTKSEVELGNHLHKVMLNEISMLQGRLDTTGTYRLQAFASKLQLSKEYPIRLTLVHSDIVNAYALPGGQVVVYTGLLKKIKTPEALAALLAHESTHVNERHSLRSLLRSSANGLLVAIVFGDVTGISGVLTSNAENLSGLQYSRRLESEADEKGMDLMRINDIKPVGMLHLMHTLEQQGDLPHVISFLSSHPLTRNRIKTAEAYCRKHPQSGKERPDLKVLFDALKKSV